MSLSQKILERLLAAGERAEARGGAGPRREKLSDPAHEYWSLALHERDALHVRMRQAEDAGGVTLVWDRFGGEDRPLASVRLVSTRALATFLGATRHDERIKHASDLFAPWHNQVQQLDIALSAWRELRSVRGRGPESAALFADAAKVIVHMRQAPDEGVVRVVSRELFRDSKRLEALVPYIAYLLAPESTLPRHAEEVLAEIGLRKEPVPFLFAGSGDVLLADGLPASAVFPYVGVAASQVRGFRGDATWILSIENLTTFHLAAQRRPGASAGLVLYTGGMPSPSWRRAYHAVVASLPTAAVHHFGDFDPGGFRIASCLAETLGARPLIPWCMEPPPERCDTADERTRAAMVYAARRTGWMSLADRIAARDPGVLEQEDLTVLFPGEEAQ